MIELLHHYRFSCDTCTATHDVTATDMDSAVATLKEFGWSVDSHQEEYSHTPEAPPGGGFVNAVLLVSKRTVWDDVACSWCRWTTLRENHG